MTPIAPPAAADPAGETNRYLTRFKTSLVKRWSHTPDAIRRLVADAPAKFAAAAASTSQKWICHRYSRALCRLFLFAELAAAAHPFAAYYDPAAPDQLITQTRPLLAKALT